jgi:hypothetical protein
VRPLIVRFVAAPSFSRPWRRWWPHHMLPLPVRPQASRRRLKACRCRGSRSAIPPVSIQTRGALPAQPSTPPPPTPTPPPSTSSRAVRRRGWLTAGNGPSLSVLQAAGTLTPLTAGGSGGAGGARTVRSGSVRTGTTGGSGGSAAIGLGGAATHRTAAAGSVGADAAGSGAAGSKTQGTGVGDATARPTLHIGGDVTARRDGRKAAGVSTLRPELQALHDRCVATVDMALQVRW